jgi:ABC-2 type transport system permease protein
VIGTIAGVTVRSLLARRRAVLMTLLALVPVLIGILARLRGQPGDAVARTSHALEPVVVAALLPLLALVFGTAALGAELEDGSAIHLLTKPVARWRIIVAKILAAVPITAGLACASTLVTGLLIGGGAAAGLTTAYVIGVAVGCVLYVTLFVALSVLTTRALIIGLAYVVIWEGVLAGLFEGTRVLSIRQYVMALVAALDPTGTVGSVPRLAPAVALTGAALVFGIALLVAVEGLERHEVAAGD